MTNGAPRRVGAVLVDNPKKRDKLGRKSRETASRYTMPKLISGLTKSVAGKLPLTEPGQVPEPRNRMVMVQSRWGR